MGSTKPKVISLEKVEKGSDELNFAEFPLAALTDRVPPDQKSLVFKDSIFDQSQGSMVDRTLTIAASDTYGLPTPLDDEVILGLIQLTQRRSFESRTVNFTRYELIKLLGWKDVTNSYARIEQSLKRWLGVTLYWDNSWWSKEDQSWVDEHFHIIDNVTILDRDRQKSRRKRNPSDPEAHKSSFTWNEVVFRSFQSGNLKQLDLHTYTSLKRPIAKRIYRFMDKRFYRRAVCQWELKEFATQKVGISSNYNVAQIKRKLNPALDELEAIGFLARASTEERYQKQARGLWHITLTRGPRFENHRNKKKASPIMDELTRRGVTLAKAEKLVSDYPEDFIREKLTLFDYLYKKDNAFCDNPGGFIVKAIEDDYQFPKTKKQTQASTQPKSRVSKQAQLKSKPDPLRERIEKMTDKEKEQILEEALEHTTPFLRKQYEQSKANGGSLFEAVRDNVIAGYLERKN